MAQQNPSHRETPETFGETVRRLREERDWSIRELARQSGLSAAQISRIEAGDVKKPSAETVLQIAKALDAKPDQLGDWLQLAGRLGREGDSLAAYLNTQRGRGAGEAWSWPLGEHASSHYPYWLEALTNYVGSGAVPAKQLREVAGLWSSISPERRKRIVDFVRDQAALSEGDEGDSK